MEDEQQQGENNKNKCKLETITLREWKKYYQKLLTKNQQTFMQVTSESDSKETRPHILREITLDKINIKRLKPLKI